MPEKLFKIGEVMKYSKISRQTIHNYTMLGLIKPASRTDSGHRLYGSDVFDRLEKIDRYKRHHTLEEVKEMMDKMDAALEIQSVKIGEKTSELEH